MEKFYRRSSSSNGNNDDNGAADSSSIVVVVVVVAAVELGRKLWQLRYFGIEIEITEVTYLFKGIQQ